MEMRGDMEMSVIKSENGKKLTKILINIFLSVSFVIFLTSCVKNYPNDTGYKAKLHKDTLEITGYSGTETNLSIPNEIGGFPVTYISSEIFMNRAESVIIPESVIKIGKKFNIPFIASMKNKLIKITIGQNVDIVKIGGKGTDGRFDRFRSDYEKNKKKAGTYFYKNDGLVDSLTGGSWVFEE
jgi:hypothetical protein